MLDSVEHRDDRMSVFLSVSRADVRPDPFPHVVTDSILPQPLFDALKRDYPSESVFGAQAVTYGKSGSRTGNGFDIYRGDAAYDRLVRDSTAWAAFDAYINSPAFVSAFLELFGPDLSRIGCSAQIDPARYDREHVERRELLTDSATFKDRLDGALHRLWGRRRGHGSIPLFSRLDIQRSVGGYTKPPHCDRPNRLCSLIIYFTDAEATGLEGGELQIFRHREDKPFHAYERHPAREDVVEIARVRSRPNTGVFFPCCNNSYHGVTAVTSQGIARDFLYINISGCAPNLW